MTKRLTRFEDMKVWQDAQDLAVVIYKTTENFPKQEQYALTSQIRRSASSVSAKTELADLAQFRPIQLKALAGLRIKIELTSTTLLSAHY